MVYFFIGTFEKRKKAFENELKRFFEYEEVRVGDHEFSSGLLDGLIGARSLFGKPMLVIFEGALVDEDKFSLVLSYIEMMEHSENVFCFLEPALSSTNLKMLHKQTQHVFDLQETKQEEKGFNLFSLTDAFSTRDKKGTWVLFQKALREGVSSMEIAPLIMWSLKTMMLVSGAQITANELGMKPFVFNKALSSSKKWKREELRDALQNLVFIYHDDRRGGDLTSLLELFFLKTL